MQAYLYLALPDHPVYQSRMLEGYSLVVQSVAEAVGVVLAETVVGLLVPLVFVDAEVEELPEVLNSNHLDLTMHCRD